jgi:LmbE family N-acetylglucosaminyl deacetylase
VTAPRVQVVVAHPDDETFGCGSLLLHAAAAGAVTAVCCASRGEAGHAREGSGLRPEQLGTARERELREAAALLGVGTVDLLGFRDSGMSGPAGSDTVSGAPFDAVVAAVRETVEAFRPDVVVTLDASDGHRDHARVRDAALAVADAAGVPRAYLSCLPRSLMRRWIAEMQRSAPDVEHLEADLSTLGTPDHDITTVIDAVEHLPVRETAIAAHASQTSPFEALPQQLRRAFLDTVHLRRVKPPWTGGALETRLLPAAG